ncbi:hypothetical protein EHEL_050620 [Encephalitozoon hellem ATCC 50504]|uniref:WD40 domain-containing protein n=1 Tax=Encephalitozoon hellem TaxID=27973 RepID=A0A9Q9C2Z3_ENCHE|nr:uncharacterized protein EHEL_050620 [Encephalitozoon hellem ATCC 50504]AFM98273.1 hypothetical protein EHEL_050620 [Encephalitozoon hellem ATCC 50504]UTX43151.1 WD40 domain-containing protein [Encephalitozoon hellem]WEL38608.1 WD40 domain-containing protein [Encephalitozoon hellem]|eukprot:XP_003887254.1 hypothetical protein EHEL_050620 [Encephalitozoon hellem ATCC 50504]
MDTVLVKLVDRSHPEVEHNPLHVSPSFCTEDLERYLRSVLGGNGGYRFYMEGQLFEGCLQKGIEARGLEIEKGVSIEYEVDGNCTPDVTVELEDPVSFLDIAKTDMYEIWCGTYGGELQVYVYQGDAIVLRETTSHKRIRGISHGDKLYIYSSDGEVLSLRSGGSLFKVDGEITCLASSHTIVSAGTHEGECYVFKEKLMKVHKFKAQISSTIIDGDEVTFACVDGSIGAFNTSTNAFKTRDVGYNLTSADTRGDRQVFGTSCSGLVVESKGQSMFVGTGIRFSSKVSIYNSCIVAQASQHTISIINTKNSQELRRITTDGYISDIGWVGNLLVVGVGSRIQGYIIHNLE